MTEDRRAITENALAAPYGYSIPLQDFFTCALSVDCIIFGYLDEQLQVLLIQRGAEPYQGDWALPGDLMYPNEGLEVAANRVLRSLTGMTSLFMEQAGSFGQVDRHPIGRVVTVSYYALVNIKDYSPKADSWAENLEWHSMSDLPTLAFDHASILDSAKAKLQEQVENKHIAFNLLPEKFTLNQAQSIYESVLEKKFDKANFRKKMLSSDLLEALDELESNVSHRPAKLYRLRCQSVLDKQLQAV